MLTALLGSYTKSSGHQTGNSAFKVKTLQEGLKFVKWNENRLK